MKSFLLCTCFNRNNILSLFYEYRQHYENIDTTSTNMCGYVDAPSLGAP